MGGLYSFLEFAAASTAIFFFGVRRTSEVVKLLTSDVAVDSDAGTTSIKVVRQENVQVGLLVAMEGACPVRILS